MERARKLRALIQKKEILVAPGVSDALSAKLVEAAGFESVYMTGFGTAASLLGFPDIGLMTMTEMVENAKRISDAVTIPVIADADTGYGNQLNVKRTVEEYGKAGVSAIHIEDQVFPKRCGHMGGNQIIPLEEMLLKVRAASDARRGKDFVLIGRTDAISAVGFEEAIERGNAFLEAGVDVMFVEAPQEKQQLEAIPKMINGPVLINMGPRTPNLDYKSFEDMGYSMIIYPLLCLMASMEAIIRELNLLKENCTVEQWTKEGASFDDILKLLNLDAYTL